MQLFKKKEELDCKVQLAKDFHWKILECIMTDLETTETGSILFSSSTDDEELRKRILHSLRMRDSGLLRQAVSTFNPRSMVESKVSEDPARFFARYQMSSFLKKYPEKGEHAREAALEKFKAVERHCMLYNTENYRALQCLSDNHPDYRGIVDDLQREIRKLLGERPNLDLIFGLSKHGPGSTFDAKQHGEGKSTCYYKWSTLPYTVTEKAEVYLRSAIFHDARWSRALFTEIRTKSNIGYDKDLTSDVINLHLFCRVNGSRTGTVPKTSDIDRTVALEPTGNVFLQLGVDGFIRGRLKRIWNIDLNDQGVNQELAKEGSITGKLATLDLSAASDCVTIKICQLLLPPGWYDLLMDLRSPCTLVDDQWVTLEKISSMGNGYTFALESVIFAAIARVVMARMKVTGVMSVYGDDIIVPVDVAPNLIDVLLLAGFKVNEDKTFIDGDFRESCGTDWIRGFSVRPLFLTKEIKYVQDLFYLHNSLWKKEDDLSWTFGIDFHVTRAYIRSCIPMKFRMQFVGPPSASLDNYLFSSKKRGKHLGNGLYRHWYIRTKAKVYKMPQSGFYFRILMASLRGESKLAKWDLARCPDTGNAFDITRRDRTTFVCSLGKTWLTHVSKSNIDS